MPLKDALKVTRKTFFNPTGWLGYSMLSTQFKMTWRLLKGFFTVPSVSQDAPIETFEQAAERFNLSPEQLDKMAFNFFLYSIILVTCAVISFVFSIYLIFHHGSFAGFILGLATMAVFGAYAFRFSFLRFQIKHRKLGCTFQEWLAGKPDANKEDLHP